MLNIRKFIDNSFFPILTFFIPFIIISNYNLNHWYIHGPYLLDTGWFSFITSNSVFPYINNHPGLGSGGSFLNTHLSPIFWILSGIKKLFFFLPDQIYYCLTQGLWVGILAISTFYLIPNHNKRKAIAFIAGLFTSLNGITISIIHYPHYEIAIPALIALFFSLWIHNNKLFAFLTLILCLTVREDAGLHIFGLMFTIGFYFLCVRDFEKSKIYFKFSLFCLFYSIITIIIQKTYFVSDSALARIYTGNPPYDHINFQFILERIKYYATDLYFIFIPLLTIIIFSIIKRLWLLLLGCFTVLPWILFSIIAIADQAGKLTLYYSFPLMIIFFWPLIFFHISEKKLSLEKPVIFLQIFCCSFSALTLSLFYSLILNSHFRYIPLITQTESDVLFLKQNFEKMGKVKIDHSIASFLSDKGGKHLIERPIKDADTLIYFDEGWQHEENSMNKSLLKPLHYYKSNVSNISLATKLELNLIFKNTNFTHQSSNNK